MTLDNFLKMAGVQSTLFVYMAVGFYCRKAKIFNDVAYDRLTEFVLKVTLPCMVLDSFNMEFSMEILRRGGLALVIATGMAFISLFIGKIAYNRFPPEEKSIFRYGTLVSNSGFAGMPLVSGAYGPEGLLLASLYIIPTRILMWSVGLSLFTTAKGKDVLKKILLNPAIIAVELGLVRMVLQIPLPAFLDNAVENLGICNSPLAMGLVGAALANVDPRSVFSAKCMYLAAMRQLVLPGICLAILRLLGVDPLTMAVSVILTGMPIGAATTIVAQRYGANASFASKCVFVSTLTSLVTVPVLTLFL